MANITPLRLALHEILEKVNAYKLRGKKIDFLKSYNNDFCLTSILQLNFNPHVKLSLPEGAPPFKRDDSPVGYTQGRLKPQILKLANLLPHKNIIQIKKEKIFCEILESIHGKDADVIVAAKDKKLETIYPGITIDIVREVFPRLELDTVPWLINPKK